MTKPREQRMREKRMKELAVITDRMSQSDKRFFERFPERRHRVRLAHDAEIEQGAIVNEEPVIKAPAGYRHYIVVKMLSEDCRMRLGILAPENRETDTSDEMAAAVFNHIKAARPQAQRIEDSMVEMLEKRGA